MKLFKAIAESPVSTAVRVLGDADLWGEGQEPNVALIDERIRAPKAFRVQEDQWRWQRRSLKEAKKFDDWEPALDRQTPPTPKPATPAP